MRFTYRRSAYHGTTGFRGREAAAARYPKGGRFITGSEPSVELAVGERALLFITKVDVGWVGGGRQALVVSHNGKFVIAGDRVGGRRRRS